jgi:phenylpyruvate tautomerase PptA (4-oxalocrotonate tautomerase family)
VNRPIGAEKVPLYTIATQVGALSADDKGALAAKVTEAHCQMSGVPENWVHVVFHEFPAGNGFTGGKPAATAALTSLIRAGRSPEYKRDLAQRLWRLLQDTTGAADDQIVIGIQELPPSQAMEMGQIMPDIADY